MARKIKMSANILNIALHPHSKDIYLDFMRALFKQKGTAQVFGDRMGVISSLSEARIAAGILEGAITTFLKVDVDGDWFDVVELKEAADADIAKVNIPVNIAPNSVTYFFEFDANTHKLHYQSYTDGHTLTPQSARRLFQGLASDLAITKQFGLAKVSVVQEREGLDKLFALKRIDEIQITIARPNPDIFADDFEAKIEAHMEQTNARSITVQYNAESGKSVVPTAEIREVSETALENGQVDVRGRDAVGAVRLSTKDFPKTLQSKYDPDATAEQSAFRTLVADSKH